MTQHHAEQRSYAHLRSGRLPGVFRASPQGVARAACLVTAATGWSAVVLAAGLCLSGCRRFGYDELDIPARDGSSPTTPSGDGGVQGPNAQVGGDGAGGGAGTSGNAGGSASMMEAGILDGGARNSEAGVADSGPSSTASDASSNSGDASTMPTLDAGVADASLDAGSSNVCAGATLEGRRLDVVAAQVVGGPHMDFPVLVSLTAPWLASVDAGGSVSDPQGADLRFSADTAGMSLLAAEVEQYDPVAGTLLAWVRVPSLTSSTSFYLLYGSCAGELAPPTASVWTSYAAVWHLKDNSDATRAGSDCIDEAALPSAPGRIGDGRAISGTPGTLNCGSVSGVDDLFHSGGLLSLWLQPSPNATGPQGRFLSKEDPNAMNVNGWGLFLDSTPSGSLTFLYDSYDGRSGDWSTPAGSVAQGSWHWIVMQYSSASTSESPQFFVDGQPVAIAMSTQPSGTLLSDGPNTLYIGNMGNVSRSFEGTIDELRLAKGTRSAEWIATEFNNQSSPEGFLTISIP